MICPPRQGNVIGFGNTEFCIVFQGEGHEERDSRLRGETSQERVKDRSSDRREEKRERRVSTGTTVYFQSANL